MRKLYPTKRRKTRAKGARLIKESAIEKHNLFFIIAAASFALCWLLAEIFRITGPTVLFMVFLAGGAVILGAAYISEIGISVASARPSAIILLAIGAAFVAAVFLNKRKLKTSKIEN